MALCATGAQRAFSEQLVKALAAVAAAIAMARQRAVMGWMEPAAYALRTSILVTGQETTARPVHSVSTEINARVFVRATAAAPRSSAMGTVFATKDV